MGYLTDNAQLIAGLKTARKHLEPGGVLIFDGWFGPAVLSERPEKRCHQYKYGRDTITREASPHLDPVRQTVTVHYDVSTLQGGEISDVRIQEDHIMRLMFVQEMALAMETAGLQFVRCCPFLDLDGELTTATWNVTFVARRK